MWELEELLNKLIEKGWKPFDRNFNGYENWCLIREFITKDGVYSYWQYPTTYRELCSKESWLWQFVCENGMIKEGNVKNFVWTRYEHTWFEPQYPLVHKWNSAEYRLIESTLCDEDKLKQFLLDNIKIWN